MKRQLLECERFLAATEGTGTEVLYQVKNREGEVLAVDMTKVIREMVETIRALEKLIEARNITEAGGLGGLGRPSA